MWSILMSTLMTLTANPDHSEIISIDGLIVEESILRIDASIENNNDFSVCIPRDQLPIGYIDAEIIVLESEGEILYHQSGIRPDHYPMWVMLPPDASVRFVAIVDLRYFLGATGTVTGHIHISGLPCSQVTRQTLITAPIPDYFFPDVSEYADEYIFFRSDFFPINLPDPD